MSSDGSDINYALSEKCEKRDLFLSSNTSASCLCQDQDKFSELLTKTENWLYNEGDEQDMKVYLDKLEQIQVFNPIQ